MIGLLLTVCLAATYNISIYDEPNKKWLVVICTENNDKCVSFLTDRDLNDREIAKLTKKTKEILK